MIDVKGLKKSFGGTEVLKGVDISVDKGDVVVILGPSGSGKTTLLRCINFLEKATEGTMVFDGVIFDLSRMSRKDIQRLRMKTAFVFQNYNLFSNMTVLKNVELGLRVARGMNKAEAEEIALRMLDKVGLKDKKDAYPSQLSGGQQQRVAIARALASSPEVIYFDEPTSALDPELIGEVLAVMRDLADEGMTMVVVTHEMNFARNISNKVIFLDGGYVAETSPTKEFFENPKSERARAFVRMITADRTLGEDTEAETAGASKDI